MTAQETSVANAFETELTAAVTDSDLTFPVATVGSLTSPCYLVIDPDNPTKREYVLFDGTFTATDFVTTSVSNRGLTGSASGAQSHSKGAKVRSAPMAQHVDDLNDRIDLSATDTEVVHLAGVETITGAKTFSTDPTLADGSSALSVTEGNAAYRWAKGELVYDVTHPDYGADNTGASDSTAAIQAAIDAAAAAAKGGTVFFPPGTYAITSELAVTTSKVTLAGPGDPTEVEIHLQSATANAIRATGPITGFTVRNLTITCFAPGTPNTRTAGRGISLTDVGNYLIDNVRLRHAWDAIYLSNSHTGIIRNVNIDDDAATVSGGGLNRGIVVTDISISTRIENVYGAAGNSTAANEFIRVDSGTDTLNIIGVEAVWNWSHGVHFVNSGVSYNPRWVRMTDCYFEPDDSGGVGVLFTACTDVELKGIYIKGGQYGLRVNASTAKQMRVIGGVIQLTQNHGVLLENGTGFLLNGVLVSDCGQAAANTYDGIITGTGVTDFAIVNCRSGNAIWNGTGGFTASQRRGINITDTASDRYALINNDCRDNLTAAIQDNGTGTSKVRFGREGAGTVYGLTWGDVNLYRYGIDKLRTDDLLMAAGGIGVGNSAAATTPGSVVRKMQVFDAAGASLGYVPIYDAIT